MNLGPFGPSLHGQRQRNALKLWAISFDMQRKEHFVVDPVSETQACFDLSSRLFEERQETNRSNPPPSSVGIGERARRIQLESMALAAQNGVSVRTYQPNRFTNEDDC